MKKVTTYTPCGRLEQFQPLAGTCCFIRLQGVSFAENIWFKAYKNQPV